MYIWVYHISAGYAKTLIPIRWSNKAERETQTITKMKKLDKIQTFILFHHSLLFKYHVIPYL